MICNENELVWLIVIGEQNDVYQQRNVENKETHNQS